jgi:hypothetical protein
MKQVLSIVISVVIFALSVSYTNSLGILLTLIGGAWYTVIEMRRKEKKKNMVKVDSVLPMTGNHDIERTSDIKL